MTCCRTVFLACCAGLLLALPAGAQQEQEQEFLRDAAAKLDAFATRCLKSGYPRRAREIWREVIRDYAADDAAAREALGYIRVGSSWAPDPDFEFPASRAPDPAVARVLGRQWDSLAEDLADGHTELAEDFAAAGMAERAQHHYERVLRFRPEDEAAIRATGRTQVDGLTGSAVELAILERSRRIDAEIATQLERTYDVEPVAEGTSNEHLERGEVPVRGFQTENFVVWGNWPDDDLITCAQYSERALAFCRELFGEYDGFAWSPRSRYHLAYFRERDQWRRVLENNAAAFGPGRLSFVLANTSATVIGAGETALHAIGFETTSSIHDMAIRAVAHRFTHLRADALVEGIGHAIVGWFLNRNLAFTVAQRQADRRTTTGIDEARFTLPDLAIW